MRPFEYGHVVQARSHPAPDGPRPLRCLAKFYWSTVPLISHVYYRV
jgi:hypothetical protein